MKLKLSDRVGRNSEAYCADLTSACAPRLPPHAPYNQPISSRRTMSAIKATPRLGVIQARDVAEPLTAVGQEHAAVFDVEFLQRLEAVGREARKPRSPAAWLPPLANSSTVCRWCTAAATAHSRSETGTSSARRFSGRPSFSPHERRGLLALAVIGVARLEILLAACRGRRRGSSRARSRASPEVAGEPMRRFASIIGQAPHSRPAPRAPRAASACP